jgi:hypothetical protein
VARRLVVLLELQVRLADVVPRARFVGNEPLRLDEVLERRRRTVQRVEVEAAAAGQQLVARLPVGSVASARSRRVERLGRRCAVVGVEEFRAPLAPRCCAGGGDRRLPARATPAASRSRSVSSSG